MRNRTLQPFAMIVHVEWLVAFAAAVATGADVTKDLKTVIRLTKPLPLYPGEVTNSFHKLPIPPGPIAIYEFAADVVEKDFDGSVVPVPFKDAYLHHHLIFSDHKSYEHLKHRRSPMKPHSANRGVGFGAGTESRGTHQKFPYPFAFTTVKGEDHLIANVHIINTRRMGAREAGLCLECPCTREDLFSNNGTILGSVAGRRHSWDRCNLDLVKEQNTACKAETYHGGLICCEDGEFCLDGYQKTDKGNTNALENANSPEVSTYYLRYNLTYGKVTKDTKPLSLASCCDASGNQTVSGNIEYDIPKICEEDAPLEDESCVHTLSTVQMLHGSSSLGFGLSSSSEEDKWVDVVYMVGHLHRGGIKLTARDGITGEIICQSVPAYGTGDEVGNERDYINAMSTCSFNPPWRMKTNHPIALTALYDARKAHAGVMSLFYIAIAEDDNKDGVEGKRSMMFWQWAWLATVAACAFVVLSRYTRHVEREGYEMVPNTTRNNDRLRELQV